MRTSGTRDREKLSRIGFFHFGQGDKVDPVASLRKSLSSLQARSTSLGDCLLVLPEAFNVLGGYFGDHADASIGSALKQISAETKIAFVAGLIEPSQGSTLGCNSACLVDGDCCRLISKKRQYTRPGATRTLYRPCRFDGPILHGGLRIAALVCNDADQGPDCFGSFEDRRSEFLKTTEALKTADPIVLCVPACFSTARDLTAVAKLWPEASAAVIANGHSSCSSVICTQSTTMPGTWEVTGVKWENDWAENHLKVVPLNSGNATKAEAPSG